LREIAEAGRARPLLGGTPLITWGVDIAIAALIHWAIMTRLLPLPLWVLGPWWLFTMAGGALAVAFWPAKPEEKATAMSTGNRVSRAVWGVSGAFLGTLALGLMLKAVLATRAGAPDGLLLMSVMPPVTFGVYGIALTATSVAADAKWLRDYAWVAFGFTVGTAAIIGEPAQFLLMAAGAITCSVVPGIRLLRTGGAVGGASVRRQLDGGGGARG